VIAFGAAIRGAEAFRRFAQPGIRLAAEPDSELYAFAAVEPLSRAYNLILEAASGREDLEALVLVHPHVEITDGSFCAKVRSALRDPAVGVVGCAGATGVRSIAWWEGDLTSATLLQRYDDHGGGTVVPYSWTALRRPPADVEVVDGKLLVLSPWVVHNVRFDETLILNHGYDVDFCLQVRAVGQRIAVADLQATYHLSLKLVNNREAWVESHVRVSEKWDHALTGSAASDEQWKRRARLAEADSQAARAIEFSKSLKSDARILELERELDEALGSVSWRLTAPLRALNRMRRRGSAAHARGHGESPPLPQEALLSPRQLAHAGARGAPPPRTRSSRAAAGASPPDELDAPARSTS